MLRYPVIATPPRPAPTSLRVDVLVAVITVAVTNRRQCLEGIVRRRTDARRTALRLLTHDLFQALFQVAAHEALHTGAIGTDHADHEILSQDGLSKMLLLGNHLQQDTARNVRVVLLVDDDELDPFDDQPPDIDQRYIPAFNRVIESTIRVFFYHSRFAHRAPRSCWPTRRRKMPVRAWPRVTN